VGTFAGGASAQHLAAMSAPKLRRKKKSSKLAKSTTPSQVQCEHSSNFASQMTDMTAVDYSPILAQPDVNPAEVPVGLQATVQPLRLTRVKMEVDTTSLEFATALPADNTTGLPVGLQAMARQLQFTTMKAQLSPTLATTQEYGSRPALPLTLQPMARVQPSQTIAYKSKYVAMSAELPSALQVIAALVSGLRPPLTRHQSLWLQRTLPQAVCDRPRSLQAMLPPAREPVPHSFLPQNKRYGKVWRAESVQRLRVVLKMDPLHSNPLSGASQRRSTPVNFNGRRISRPFSFVYDELEFAPDRQSHHLTLQQVQSFLQPFAPRPEQGWLRCLRTLVYVCRLQRLFQKKVKPQTNPADNAEGGRIQRGAFNRRRTAPRRVARKTSDHQTHKLKEALKTKTERQTSARKPTYADALAGVELPAPAVELPPQTTVLPILSQLQADAETSLRAIRRLNAQNALWRAELTTDYDSHNVHTDRPLPFRPGLTLTPQRGRDSPATLRYVDVLSFRFPPLRSAPDLIRKSSTESPVSTNGLLTRQMCTNDVVPNTPTGLAQLTTLPPSLRLRIPPDFGRSIDTTDSQHNNNYGTADSSDDAYVNSGTLTVRNPDPPDDEPVLLSAMSLSLDSPRGSSSWVHWDSEPPVSSTVDGCEFFVSFDSPRIDFVLDCELGLPFDCDFCFS
jgi:hypothetical protein